MNQNIERLDCLLMLRIGMALLVLSMHCVAVVKAGTTGEIKGRVIDQETAQPLIGANILLVGTAIGGSADTSGYYQIRNVRAGVYSVRFSMVGYTAVLIERVAVLPDRTVRLDVSLEPAIVAMDEVEVVYERPLIQKDQPVTAYSIGDLKIEKLPVSALSDLLALQPGITAEGNIRGGKPTDVLYLIDGLPAQDVIGGGAGLELPKSSIGGLTIYTGGFDVEYGNALSGVVNVVTRRGWDRHRLNVRVESDNWISSATNKQQDRAYQFEFTAGGPLLQNRLAYFSANTISLSDSRWWQDFQNFFSSPIQRELNGVSRLEYTPVGSLRLDLQGLYSVRRWRDYEFSWRYNLNGLPARSRDALRISLLLSNPTSDRSSYSINLSTFYLGSRIGEGSKESQVLEPYQYDFYLRYFISGKRNWWTDSRQMVHTLKMDWTSQLAGIHLLKIGMEVSQYEIRSELIKYEPQRTYFGKPIASAPLLSYSNSYDYFPRTGGVYVQDKIETERDGSNISVGIRWDFFDPRAERPIVEFIPKRPNEFEQRVAGTTRARFKHQFSPRFAFSAPLSPNTFFFANVGRYFQLPLFDYLYSGINPAQLGEGTRSVLTGNPDLEPERALQWEIGIKQGISENYVGSVTYFSKRFENQLDAKTLVPFDSKTAGDFGFASYVNNANASAFGLEVVLSREHDDRLSGSISYSYMVTEGTSEYVDQRINFAQWGFPLAPTTFPLSWDQRHTAKIDAEARLPWDVQTNLVVLYNSPRPYSYYPTRDGFKPLDSTYMFVPNNARMSDVIFVNLKISCQFHPAFLGRKVFTIYADIRNLFNTKNARWVDSNGRVGGELSDPSAYYDPRRAKVGMRLEF